MSSKWIHGFFDGEGTIGISHYWDKEKYNYRPYLNLSCVQRDAVRRVRAVFGVGTVQYIDRGSPRKPYAMWSVSGVKSVTIALKVLAPGLLLKWEHASTLLGFCSSWFEMNEKDRHDAYLYFRRMNALGPHAITHEHAPQHFAMTDCWAAGFIDGEATITIIRNNRRNTNYYPCMRIGTTSCMASELLKTHFGVGNLRFIDSRSDRHRPLYDWCIYKSGAVLEVLTRIRPMLTVKQQVSDVLMEYCRLPYRIVNIDERERLYQLARQLNERGC